MNTLADALTWSAIFRIMANTLTVASAFAWLKFADAREGCITSPSLHHKVYLRALIVMSTISLLCFCASLVATAKKL